TQRHRKDRRQKPRWFLISISAPRLLTSVFSVPLCLCGSTSSVGVLVRILLTNDDGIYAPGLRALRPELMKLGEVTVVAPATEQSAVGHSVTLLTPLIVQELRDDEG